MVHGNKQQNSLFRYGLPVGRGRPGAWYAAGVQAAVQAAVISAIAAAGDLAAAAFGSESVSVQIANGFPGEIGSSPPGIDNIVDNGIRMPAVGETSSERKKREDADEDERKRKLKLKVSQLN